MKSTKILFAGAAALLCASTSVQADTVIHITGSTAFRGATVTAIQNLMGGAASCKSAYQSSSGASITASNRIVIQGTIAGLPAGANPVTVKCSWAGSVGGVKTVVQNIDVTTWMSVTNLGAAGTSTGLADGAISYALDTVTFSGENARADVTMADNSQASTGFTSAPLAQTKVGVIPFEWVACNGSPATLNNITPLLAQAVIAGGVPLSQFTGNFAADSGTPVYSLGRDFDSGTRLSCLAETGVGVFGNVQHIQLTFAGGAAGASGASIANMKLWQAETVLGQSFGIGQSGYASGGSLADALATPGALSANTSSGIAAAEQVGYGPGWLIGYLGRSDAVRATRKTNIPTNDAHRMKWNGVQIWNEPVSGTGTPASYNDQFITEGLYQCWEYEYLSYRSTFGGNGKLVADAIAVRVRDFDAGISGIKLSDMHVNKSFEGGLITY